MQTIVMTSDRSDWTLSGFVYLFDKYVGNVVDDVVVCGYRNPPIKLAGRYRFYKIGHFDDFPPDKWSQSISVVMKHVANDVFMLMLDDYWVYRKADDRGLKILHDYVAQFGYVLKADVTSERLNNNPGQYHFNQNTYAHVEHLDLIKSPHGSSYQLSLWAGIWNKKNLNRLIRPNESAQETELRGTYRFNNSHEDMIVIGTRQSPLLHGNIVQSGKATPVYEDIGWKIRRADMVHMDARGWIRHEK